MSWSNNAFTDLAGIDYPILLAPMAIATTPALAAGVAAGGGLGGIGCAALCAEELDSYISGFRGLAPENALLHVRFFSHKLPIDRGLKA